MSSAQGGKWVLGITLYFLVFVIVATLTTSLYGGVIDDYGNVDVSYCSSPRYEYNIYDTTFSTKTGGETHLDCKKSIGVLSQTYCEQIQGCVWGEVDIDINLISYYSQTTYNGLVSITNNVLNTWVSILNNNLDLNLTYIDLTGIDLTQGSITTCDGTIDNEFYGIETSDFFGSEWVAKHSNSKTLSLYGSICNHPNVINNENYCNLFSCSWTTDTYTGKDLAIELDAPSNLIESYSVGKNILKTIRQLVSFEFDFGVTGYYNFIITMFLFWIPLLALIIALYVMVRS